MKSAKLPFFLKILTLFLLSTQSIFSQSGVWKEAKNKNGITVFTREHKGSEVEEYMGKVELNASLSQIASLLLDPEACDSIYHNCLEMSPIKSSSQKTFFYMRTGAPWPVATRDVVIERIVDQNPKSKVVHIRFKKTDDVIKPSPNGVVRIESLYSYWSLIPSAPGKVIIEYQAHFEPGGSVPKSVLNLVITNTPFNSLTNIKKAVEAGKFENAKLNWVSEVE